MGTRAGRNPGVGASVGGRSRAYLPTPRVGDYARAHFPGSGEFVDGVIVAEDEARGSFQLLVERTGERVWAVEVDKIVDRNYFAHWAK